VHRRRVLAAAPALLTAGCLGFGSRPRGRIGSLVVENRDDSPHTADISVDRGGETVLSETVDLAANDGDGTIPDDARAGFGPDRLPDERARYAVRVSLRDAPASESHTIPDDGAGCYLAFFHVTGPDTVTPATSTDADVCEQN